MENRVIAIAAFLACLPAFVFCRGVATLSSATLINYQGGRVVFACTASDIIRRNILWTLNGTQLEEFTNIDYVFSYNEVIETVGFLLIRNVSAGYDNTRFQCIVTFTSDNTTATTNSLIIRVQGLLNAVGELNADFFESNSSLHILWTPPFSLIANNIDPIKYCVDVVNQSSNAVISSLSSCDRMETYFVVSDIDCVTVYEVIVTPVNPVGNGTSASVVFPDNIRSCDVTGLEDLQTIEVSCNMTIDKYAVTLQYPDPSDLSRIITIRLNNTGDSNTFVIAEGISSGSLCVTIFPLVNNSYLIRSAVAFRQELKRIPTSIPTTTAASTSTTSSINATSSGATSISATSISATSSGTTPSGVIQSIPFKYFIPIVVVVVAILVIIILVVVIICCCCYLYKKRERRKSIASNESPSKELPHYSTLDSTAKSHCIFSTEEKKVAKYLTSTGKDPVKSTGVLPPLRVPLKSSAPKDLWNRNGNGSSPPPHIDNK